MSGHQHGGQVERAFAAHGLAPKPVIDFSVNVSPLGPPPALLEAWPRYLDSVPNYPDPDGAPLCDYYHQRYGLDPESVLPLNGSIEGIYLLPRLLGLKRVTVPKPGFFDYAAACRLAGVEVAPWQLDAADGFSFDGIEHQLAGVDGVFLGSPHNPTGQVIERGLLLGLCDQFPQITFMIDQAFIHLCDNPQGLSLLAPEHFRPNLLVLHSLTKEWALPGLRLGGLVGPSEVIAKLKAQLPPWRLSGPALAALADLTDQEVYENSRQEMLDAERLRLFAALADCPKLELIPSHSNFFLARYLGGLDDLLKRALERGIMLRDGRNFEGLDGDWFRFAILSPDHNDRLIEFLHE